MRALVIVICLFGVARADDVKPWVVGVSEDNQAIALAIYEQGNTEFQAARFPQALVKYREALMHWDHPSIHFNVAVCLINLSQPLEARQHLEKALKYPDALGPDLYAQGITYQRALDSQLARLKIVCREPGAVITLDGEPAFTAPGEIERIVAPGRHQVVAMKEGYQTASETFELGPSKLVEYEVRLVALKQEQRFVRRWDRWKPYAVVGAGAGTIVIGAVVYALAASAYDRYDARVANECPRGCDAETAKLIREDRQSADVKRTVAYSIFAVGGAVAVTGAVGLWLNQPRVASDRGVAVHHSGDGAIVTWTTSW